jgi:mono/diheme cytochrome c family protein
MGSFEWTREAARRPFAINGVIYSNGLLPADTVNAERDGFLGRARWSRIKEARNDRDVEAGEELFRSQCHACHTIGGFNNDIMTRTSGMSHETLADYIGNLHSIRYFMPPFAGNGKERGSLAAFIVKGLHGKGIEQKEIKGVSGAQGKELFLRHCTICHPESLVRERTAGWDLAKIRDALDHLNALNPAMPDFKGSPEEKGLIAGYIHSLNTLHAPEGGEGEGADEGRSRR